jgi:hypothetical protein
VKCGIYGSLNYLFLIEHEQSNLPTQPTTTITTTKGIKIVYDNTRIFNVENSFQNNGYINVFLNHYELTIIK